MGDYVPINEGGDQFTMTASAAITGGQVLESTGDGTVAPTASAASLKVIGVAAHDAASGAVVSVYGLFTIHETVVAGTTLVAGNQVQAGAAGTLAVLGGTPAPGQNIGVCIKGAAAAAKARWIGR